MSTNDDKLIADYLGRLEAAAAILPPDRRAELIEEIRAHIAEGMTTRDGEEPDGAASVLDRLGSPQDIVRAAAEQGGTGSTVFEPGPAAVGGPGPDKPGWPAPGGYGPARYPARDGLGGLEIAAIVLLWVGVFLAGIGWIVGVVLLWISPRWRLSDKLLGTLVWPGGLLGFLVVFGGLGTIATSGSSGSACGPVISGPGQQAPSQCPPAVSGGLPGWLHLALVLLVLVLVITAPILVSIRLVRQARRWPGELAGEPTISQPS